MTGPVTTVVVAGLSPTAATVVVSCFQTTSPEVRSDISAVHAVPPRADVVLVSPVSRRRVRKRVPVAVQESGGWGGGGRGAPPARRRAARPPAGGGGGAAGGAGGEPAAPTLPARWS